MPGCNSGHVEANLGHATKHNTSQYDGQYNYTIAIKWTGNKGTGTGNYKNYERSYDINIQNKPDILGSSDPAFHGDETKHLLVSSLSACHMLWYLHLCSEAGVIVVDYTDNATGLMVEVSNGTGKFTGMTLNPIVIVEHSK